ncbi:MAG: 2-phospho-L-lactate guanylyltransferase [Anaerolineaceae bacterium]|jgi:2-phospho-L-lactate guanylyltransferase
MSLWAIVPVKPLRRGKSFLSTVLSEDERTLLNYSMLDNTLKALRMVPEVDQVLVVSRDPAALALARNYGGRTVQEDGNPGLNTALKRATAVAKLYSAGGVLIIPADLPLITDKEIGELIARSGTPPELIIAPDRRGNSTNALLLCPADPFEFRFGVGSFVFNIQQAKKVGCRVEVYQVDAFSLDIDMPEDLDLLRRIESVPGKE